jgi:hypothetical protein
VGRLERVREGGGRKQHGDQEEQGDVGGLLAHVDEMGAENTRAKLRLDSSPKT